jgi:hypothetical protein
VLIGRLVPKVPFVLYVPSQKRKPKFKVLIIYSLKFTLKKFHEAELGKLNIAERLLKGEVYRQYRFNITLLKKT